MSKDTFKPWLPETGAYPKKPMMTICELAEIVAKQMEQRKHEDINEWADKLASDVSQLTD